MKILITGIAGFAGSHLAEYIAGNHSEVEIFGTLHSDAKDNIAAIENKHKQFCCDITDAKKVSEIISEIRPDIIFHLAAKSYVHSSWEDPQGTLHTNIIGQSNILEAVRILRNSYDPKIIIVGSSEEYGIVEQDETPIRETHALRPTSPYALSKVAQDYMGYQYWKAYGMQAIRVRPFSHTGTRRPSVYAVSGFIHSIVQMEKGLRKKEFFIRDLSAVRDFSDVRDIVRGYWVASQKCAPGEVYNICSGKGVTLKAILDYIVEYSLVKDEIRFIQDPAGKRPNDGGVIIGDHAKFTQTTGWEPEFDFFKDTIPSIFSYWRKKL